MTTSHLIEIGYEQDILDKQWRQQTVLWLMLIAITLWIFTYAFVIISMFANSTNKIFSTSEILQWFNLFRLQVHICAPLFIAKNS